MRRRRACRADQLREPRQEGVHGRVQRLDDSPRGGGPLAIDPFGSVHPEVYGGRGRGDAAHHRRRREGVQGGPTNGTSRTRTSVEDAAVATSIARQRRQIPVTSQRHVRLSRRPQPPGRSDGRWTTWRSTFSKVEDPARPCGRPLWMEGGFLRRSSVIPTSSSRSLASRRRSCWSIFHGSRRSRTRRFGARIGQALVKSMRQNVERSWRCHLEKRRNGGYCMTMPPASSDPLLSWRKEFPILDTHGPGGVTRSGRCRERRRIPTVVVDEWSSCGVRACAEGWWEIGRTTGDLLAPLLGVQTGTISMHQNVTGAMAVIASCFRYDGPRRPWPPTPSFRPTSTRSRWLRRMVPRSFRCRRPDDAHRPAAAVRCDRRAHGPARKRTCSSEAPTSRTREGHRGASRRRARDPRCLPGRTVPMNIEGLGADFAVGGSVEVAVGGPALATSTCAQTRRRGRSAYVGRPAHASPFEFTPGSRRTTRIRRSASRAAHPTCRRSIPPALVTRS